MAGGEQRKMPNGGEEKAKVAQGEKGQQRNRKRQQTNRVCEYLGAGSSSMSSRKSLMMFVFCSTMQVSTWPERLHTPRCHAKCAMLNAARLPAARDM